MLFTFLRSTVFALTASVSLIGIGAAIATELPVQSIEANGFQMKYTEKGSGPLLVLIHGSFSDHRTWQDHFDGLAGDFRVVAPTMRYFGPDDWNEDWPKYSDKLSADDIAAFIKALDAGPAHLVGWSRGGRVAHLISLKYPDIVRSAYFFEGVARMPLDEATQKVIGAATREAFGPAIGVLREKGPAAAIPVFIDSIAGSKGAFDELPDWTKEMYLQNARTVPITGSNAFKPELKTCEEMNASQVPTMLAIGSDTAPAFAVSFEPYQSCLDSSKTVMIQGATHAWPRQEKEAFIESVKSFVSKH